MSRLINTELFKLRHRSMTWILLYILMGLIIIFYLVLFAVSRISLPTQGGNGPPIGTLFNILGLATALPFAFYLLSFFGSVLAVILMASSVGNEYNWRTIRLALISSESRVKFLAAKIVSVLVLIIIGMIIGVATGFIMSLITTAIGGYSFNFSFATGAYLWNQFIQFWRTFFIILPFTFLAFFFAVLGRSAMPGIAVGIGVGFLEPIITTLMRLAGGWVASIPNYLFTANVNAINALNTLPEGFRGGGFGGNFSQLPSPSHSYMVLGIYTVVFIILGFFFFHRRDLTG